MFSLPQNKSMRTRCGWEHVDGICKICPHDWGFRALAKGDLVLDGRGHAWEIREFAYGRENFAICNGLGFNRHSGMAVRLGESFLIEEEPTNARHGRAMYESLFDTLRVGDRLLAEARERRAFFQRNYGPGRG